MLDSENLVHIKRTFSFWDKLAHDEQEYILSHTKPVKYTKGDNIHSAKNDCVGVLLLKTGMLRAYILSKDGREITLYRLSPGEVCILSASCLIKSITFDVYIDAECDSEILLVNAEAFSKLMEKNVWVENFSLRTTVDKFSDVMWTMEQILFMSFDRRLAVFLLDEAAKTGFDTILLTHEQIAKYVGSAREVVSRMLKYFEKEGIVAVSRGEITIVDKKKLKKLM